MRALFLTKYSRLGGSSRHMVYSYLPFFEQAGIDCTVAPLFDDRYFSIRELSHRPTVGEVLGNAGYFLRRAFERILWSQKARHFDAVVLEYELLPYAPYCVERMLYATMPRLISIYDDAVYEAYRQHPAPLVRWLCSEKVAGVIQRSQCVVAWNATVAEYAKQLNDRVLTVSTAIDISRYRRRADRDRSPDGRVVIGWIGTPNSFRFVRDLEPVFERVSRFYPVELRIVSSEPYMSDAILVSNHRWGLETEVEDLCSFDIGIMPLADDPQTRGKSGYKAVQYMAVGIPAVCSPVGVNKLLVEHGRSGFLAASQEEWYESLVQLIEHPELREQMGATGRALVDRHYSTEVVAPQLVAVLQGCM